MLSAFLCCLIPALFFGWSISKLRHHEMPPNSRLLCDAWNSQAGSSKPTTHVHVSY